MAQQEANFFRTKALALIREDPRCVHKSRQPLNSSSDPDQIARFHFGQGFQEFEVTIDLPVDLPKEPRGLARYFSMKAYQSARAIAEVKAKDCAIDTIVEILEARLTISQKQRLLALLEAVQRQE